MCCGQVECESGDVVRLPAGVPVRRWAREQALAACVHGAPGWFATPVGGNVGAVNVPEAAAVLVDQDLDDGHYTIAAVVGNGGFTIGVGPYLDEYEAAEVCRAVLLLSYDRARWPAAEDDEDGPAAAA
jgi:hypothetical protein